MLYTVFYKNHSLKNPHPHFMGKFLEQSAKIIFFQTLYPTANDSVFEEKHFKYIISVESVSNFPISSFKLRIIQAKVSVI